MNTNVNLEAGIGVLTFLGTAFVLGLAVIILLHAFKKGKRTRARKIGAVSVAGVGLYLALLLSFSFLSRERVLAFGEEKHFCEMDCHLAYSVTNLRKANLAQEDSVQS
jgi:multisubunit Na+/H+ antiporter MnhB subunit